jgi:hypothetical protein
VLAQKSCAQSFRYQIVTNGLCGCRQVYKLVYHLHDNTSSYNLQASQSLSYSLQTPKVRIQIPDSNYSAPHLVCVSPILSIICCLCLLSPLFQDTTASRVPNDNQHTGKIEPQQEEHTIPCGFRHLATSQIPRTTTMS